MMKMVFILGMIALLIGCDSIQKDVFVITGTISSYPKEVLICAYQRNGDFVLDNYSGGKRKTQLSNEVTGTGCRLPRFARSS